MNYCQSCALCRQNCSTSPTFIHVGELHKPGLLGFINCSSHMVNCLFLWRVDGFFSELSVSISPFNCSSSLLSCHSPMRWKFSEKMRVLCTEHSCYQKPGHTGRWAGHWILVWSAKITKVEYGQNDHNALFGSAWLAFSFLGIIPIGIYFYILNQPGFTTWAKHHGLLLKIVRKPAACQGEFGHLRAIAGKAPKALALPRFWVWITKQLVKKMVQNSGPCLAQNCRGAPG